MATPINAPMAGEIWHLSIEDLFQPVQEAPRLGGEGPFVINLSASTAPISIPTKSFAGCSEAHVYQIQVTEDGRTRYRLRLGPFVSEDEADAVLVDVRDTYPGALTATAGAADLRVIATMAAKAETRPPTAQAPAEMPVTDKPLEISIDIAWPTPALVVPPLRTAPSAPTAAPAAAPKPAAPAIAPKTAAPAVAPKPAAPAIAPAAAGPAVAPKPAAPAIAPAAAGPAVAAKPAAPAIAPATAGLAVAAKPAAPAIAPAAAGLAVAPKPAAPAIVPAAAGLAVAPKPAAPAIAPKAAAPAVASKPAASAIAPAAAAPTVAPPAPKAAPAPAVAPVPVAMAAPVLTEEVTVKSKVPPVLTPFALTPPALTPPVLTSPAMRQQPPARTAAPSIKAPDKPAAPLRQSVAPARKAGTPLRSPAFRPLAARLTSLQHVVVATAPAPAAREVKELDEPLDSLESTQTMRALTASELEDNEASRWFVIELALADRAFDPDAVPNLDIFSEYRLYSVAGSDQGRVVHALRLGFFREEIGAVAVASYLGAYWDKPTIKRVSLAERERFADQRVEARKDVGATGRHAVIEITDELVARRRRAAQSSVPGTKNNPAIGR
ncbi:MAG TPA: SPOR domain-containing protein [Steroidobacteraceae bacterium]|nr:SPOR domain-containing protein [Steroidobacteraceae bacterium]